ncbi:MAG: saccharopine dehydrogenase C-terminal domain-containing protein [Thermoplasmata archaeon]
MSHRYAVLGAGRQGIAAAYDLAKFGDSEQVILVDMDGASAKACANKINKMLNQQIATSIQMDVNDTNQLISALNGITTVISALPYRFNLRITEAAIRTGTNMCDLGGNTEIVRKQLENDARAKSKGVVIVPDCGMGPGMNISLATYAMSLLDKPREVYIWDGGLPLNPKPPWNYALTFNIGGLTNEYHGNAYFLRDGHVVEVPCFEGFEEVDFPQPLNRLEAFITSGGLSTMPWTFLGKLKRLENRTLRYPGHWAQFKAFAKLGLLELEPLLVGDVEVVPRDVLHALLKPKLTQPEVKDVCVIRVKCVGDKNGSRAESVVELIDYYDKETGFTAMQRITGWHASIVAILAAGGKICEGAIPIETIPGKMIVDEAKRRGFSIEEHVVVGE